MSPDRGMDKEHVMCVYIQWDAAQISSHHCATCRHHCDGSSNTFHRGWLHGMCWSACISCGPGTLLFRASPLQLCLSPVDVPTFGSQTITAPDSLSQEWAIPIGDTQMGATRWLGCKESTWQCRNLRRCGFNSWVRKIPWRRKWQPTPVFLPRKLHG